MLHGSKDAREVIIEHEWSYGPRKGKGYVSAGHAKPAQPDQPDLTQRGLSLLNAPPRCAPFRSPPLGPTFDLLLRSVLIWQGDLRSPKFDVCITTYETFTNCT